MFKYIIIAALLAVAAFFIFSCKEDNQTSLENNKAEGEKFLAENAKREGVIVSETGLQYEVITQGSGKRPSPQSRVRCHYEGKLINGKVFDSSFARKQPAEFALTQVIIGWTEGLQYMTEGSRYRLYLPYYMAYGAQGAGNSIPPYSALIFEVELLEVL